MKFFVDTADVSEIRALADFGFLDGVTTNPTHIAKSGRKFLDVIKEICEIVSGPVSAEVAATTYNDMLAEANVIKKIAPNITVKLPLNQDGLKLCKRLSGEGVKTNVTLCFSAGQALLAAKAGATFISPFVGRLDDVGANGMDLIFDIMEIYGGYPDLKTECLVASTRGPMHIIEAAKMGAHVATMPPSVLWALVKHPLTDKGLALFTADWKKTGQKIIDSD